MITDVLEPKDAYLDRLKLSLSASAVLKAELASLKSSCKVSRVFAYEGVSDTVIYYHWLSKLCPKLDYEPFICRNKNQLLQLFDSLQNDLNGLRDDVYFFVDRDFDELKGRVADASVFMTDKYSVENYLVNTNILDDILKVEFHCHGNKAIRENIVSLFHSTYELFLDHTTEINFRIYVARNARIHQNGELPSRLNEVADVGLDFVRKGRGQPNAMVSLEREPSEDEIAEYRKSFELLDRASRYRGKFSLQFFMKWLSLLLTARNSSESDLFNGLPQSDFVAKGPFSFEMLAAKSQPPNTFRRFIAEISEPQEALRASG